MAEQIGLSLEDRLGQSEPAPVPEAQSEKIGMSLEERLLGGKPLHTTDFKTTVTDTLDSLASGARGVVDKVKTELGHAFPTSARDRLKDIAGTAGVVTDMIWDWGAGQWATHGIIAPLQGIARMALGEGKDQAFKSANEWANHTLENIPWTSPAKKLFKAIKSGEAYEGSTGGQLTEKLSNLIKEADTSMRNVYGTPEGAVETLANQLMALGPMPKVMKAGRPRVQESKDVAKARETYDPRGETDFTVSSSGIAEPQSPSKERGRRQVIEDLAKRQEVELADPRPAQPPGAVARQNAVVPFNPVSPLEASLARIPPEAPPSPPVSAAKPRIRSRPAEAVPIDEPKPAPLEVTPIVDPVRPRAEPPVKGAPEGGTVPTELEALLRASLEQGRRNTGEEAPARPVESEVKAAEPVAAPAPAAPAAAPAAEAPAAKPNLPKWREVAHGEEVDPAAKIRVDKNTGKTYVRIEPEKAVEEPAPASTQDLSKLTTKQLRDLVRYGKKERGGMETPEQYAERLSDKDLKDLGMTREQATDLFREKIPLTTLQMSAATATGGALGAAGVHLYNYLTRPKEEDKLDEEEPGPDPMTGNWLAKVGAPVGLVALAGIMTPVGKGSSTMALMRLELAKRLERELPEQGFKGDALKDEIWRQAQLEKWPDGVWREEIPTHRLKLTADGKRADAGSYPRALGAFVDFADYYLRFPGAKKIKTKFLDPKSETQGSYSSAFDNLELKQGPRLLHDIVHELSHAGENRMQGARGGTTKEFLKDDWEGRNKESLETMAKWLLEDPKREQFVPYIKDVMEAAIKIKEARAKNVRADVNAAEMRAISDASRLPEFREFKERIDKHADIGVEYRDAYGRYQRILGEALARIAEKRLELSPEQKMNRRPSLDLDVPYDELTTPQRHIISNFHEMSDKGKIVDFETFARDRRLADPDRAARLEKYRRITDMHEYLSRAYDMNWPMPIELGQRGTKNKILIPDRETLGQMMDHYAEARQRMNNAAYTDWKRLEGRKFGQEADITDLDWVRRQLEKGKWGPPDQKGFINQQVMNIMAGGSLGAVTGIALADPEDKWIGATIGTGLGLFLGSKLGQDISRRSKVYKEAEKSMAGVIEDFWRKFNPDMLGPNAEGTSAVLGSHYIQMMARHISEGVEGRERQKFFEGLTDKEVKDFRMGLEMGVQFKDPTLQKYATQYRQQAADILLRDTQLGIKYDPMDFFIFHMLKEPGAATAYLANKYGKGWDVDINKKAFRYLNDLENQGFELVYKNPEEIMTARLYSSDLAKVKIDALQQLADFGLAREKTKGTFLQSGETVWRAPNGKEYYLPDHADQIFHNAFDSRSLWDDTGFAGMTYRSTMWTKNAIVPLKLFSLFHPVHVVAGMDLGTAGTNAIKAWAAGNISAGEAALSYIKPLTGVAAMQSLKNLFRDMHPDGMKAMRGELPLSRVTPEVQRQLQLAFDGGFSPEMSAEYKNAHGRAFVDALHRSKDMFMGRDLNMAPVRVLFEALPAALEKFWTKPVFENWIPALKWEAYQKSALTHMAANPDLASKPLERMIALRRISKMIDDRFGEMQYKTLFMDRMTKDIMVASFLSYGWQYGFARSYLGAFPEAARAFTANEPLQGRGTLRQRIAKGELDKTLFMTNYLAATMLYGGLATMALTGDMPRELMDYIYPRNGDKNPDGTDARISTPFYTREFVSIPKHMQEEGVVGGLAKTVANKVTPVYSLISGLLTNKDFFNREISDPNASLTTRVGQKMAYALGELEPISSSAPRRSGRADPMDYALAAAGFAPAPKYVTEAPEEALIKKYLKYHRPAITPYEKAQRGQEVYQLFRYKQAGNNTEFEKGLEEVRRKYKLTDNEVTRIRREAGVPVIYKQFKILSPSEQRHVLKEMKPEDRRRFAPYARREVREELGRQ